MIKAVVDTNIIVSAHLSKSSQPGKILEKIYNKEIIPVVDERIMAEYTRVLNYEKFGFDKMDVDVFMYFLKKNAKFAEAPAVLKNIKLPDDDMIFMEAAITAKVEFLITGNTKHFNFREFSGCRVIGPAEFLKIHP